MPASLLSLPGEIRNKIYRYLLVEEGPIDPTRPRAPIHVQFRRVIRVSLNILSTNSTILHEARSILYGENEFDLTCTEYFEVSRYPGIGFLDTIGSLNASYLRSIRIPFPTRSVLLDSGCTLYESNNGIDLLEKIVSCCTGLEIITIIKREMQIDYWEDEWLDLPMSSMEVIRVVGSSKPDPIGIDIIDSYFKRAPSLRQIPVQLCEDEKASELGKEMESHEWILEVVAPLPENEGW